MRKIIAKILTLIIVLNTIVSTAVLADGRTMIYADNGAGIEAVYSSDGRIFIAPKDIGAIGLTYESIKNGLRIHDGKKSLDVFVESAVIIVDGESCGFDEAVYSLDGQILGVNTALICTVFGYEYFCDGQRVEINTQKSAKAVTFSDNMTSRRMSGTIRLPNQMRADGAVLVTVSACNADSKNKVVASQSVKILSGQNAADFSIEVPENVSRVSLAYRLGDKSNLCGIGYYSEDGTKIESVLAKKFELTGDVSDISFYIIPTKKITATINMPNGRAAANDIRANVYVVPGITYGVGGEYYSSSKSSDVIIQKGSTSGSAVFDVPVQDGVLYRLGVRFASGDNSIFNSAYYGGACSVSSKHRAQSVDSSISDIEFSLIQKNTISGTVSNAQSACVIYAIAQGLPSERNGLRNAEFYTTAYSPAGSGSYTLNVPDDMERYIIGFHYANENLSKMRYYSAKGLTTDISLASVLRVNEDIHGIDIEADKVYEGEPIKFYGYSPYHADAFEIGYKNVSDEAQSNVKVMAAYYGDSESDMLGVSTVTANFAAGEAGTLRFDHPTLSRGKTPEKIRVFAWGGWDMNPVSKVRQADGLLPDTDKIYNGVYVNGSLILGSDNKIMYGCGQIMSPLDTAAQLLGTTVRYSGNVYTFTKGSVSVTLTKGSAIAYVNGNAEMAGAVMTDIAGEGYTGTVVPLEFLALCFGYGVYHNLINNNLYITF